MQPTERTMLTFRGDGWAFNVRTCAVILDPSGKRVLLHRAVPEDFWVMPGGRVEVGESAADALRREMLEEMGVEVAIERLLWMVENFFTYDTRYHEYGFYFLVTLPAESALYDTREPFYGDEGGVQLIFDWFDLDALDSVRLLPAFLVDGLRALPQGVAHIVYVEG